jgi:polyribonucleotide nucleotidyltransferase
LERENAITTIKAEAKAAIIHRLGEAGFCQIFPDMAFEELQKILERNNLLDKGRRIEARSLTELRTIEC